MMETLKFRVREGVFEVNEILEVPKKNFKQEFLKRWGNLVEKGTYKGRQDKDKVKVIVYTSKNLNEMLGRINEDTRWRFNAIN